MCAEVAGTLVLDGLVVHLREVQDFERVSETPTFILDTGLASEPAAHLFRSAGARFAKSVEDLF